MTREQTIKLAKKQGWRPWGKLRKYQGNSYQCFRRDREYAWIGLRYVERNTHAMDFVSEGKKQILEFLGL